MVWVRLLGEDGRFGSPTIHTGRGQVEAATLPGLKVDLEMVFRLNSAGT